MASAGVMRICVQARDMMNCMFRVGLVPGLKSVARATAAPASMSLRAGGYCFNPRWKFAPGRSVATTLGIRQGANI